MRVFLLLLGLILPTLARAQEPSPMSFEDMEEMEAPPSPARKAMRFERARQIDFAAEQIDGELVQGAERLSLQLELAHLLHERGRDEGDPDAIAQAVALYRELLVRLPDDRLRDHVTFFLGFALRSTDDQGESERLLREVTERWPDSTYAPHAWLHLGEYWFGTERYDMALKAYQEASSATGFELQGFARYKAAWSYERIGAPEPARSEMGRVVLDPSRPGLVRVAYEVLDYWTLRDSGRHPEAPYVEAVNAAIRSELPDTCLVDIPVWKRQIQQAPTDIYAPSHQLAIVRCLADEGRKGPARAELVRMERMYGRGSRWYRANDHAARRDARAAYKEAEGWVRAR